MTHAVHNYHTAAVQIDDEGRFVIDGKARFNPGAPLATFETMEEAEAWRVLVALYTGQSREDVVKMTWQQYQGDVIRVRQSKTTAALDIACHSVLRKHLDGLKRQAVVICATADGKAFTANGLSGAIRRRVAAIDALPNNRSRHGLRYAAGSRMEEAGCSVAEIESVLGRQTFKMAPKYASQRLRAKAAMAKMEAAEGA